MDFTRYSDTPLDTKTGYRSEDKFNELLNSGAVLKRKLAHMNDWVTGVFLGTAYFNSKLLTVAVNYSDECFNGFIVTCEEFWGKYENQEIEYKPELLESEISKIDLNSMRSFYKAFKVAEPFSAVSIRRHDKRLALCTGIIEEIKDNHLLIKTYNDGEFGEIVKITYNSILYFMFATHELTRISHLS